MEELGMSEGVELVAEVDESRGEGSQVKADAVAELERRLREVEAGLGDLQTHVGALRVSARDAEATGAAAGRKTVANFAGQGEVALAPALDRALCGLPVEQRLLVKNELMRAGVLN